MLFQALLVSMVSDVRSTVVQVTVLVQVYVLLWLLEDLSGFSGQCA